MPEHKINWAEKTAVITGSGSGIGRAVAIASGEIFQLFVSLFQ